MKVRFRFPEGEEVEVEGYPQLNLLAHAQLAEKSLQSRCGGHCECGTCRVYLRKGQLSSPRTSETELLRRAGEVRVETRLACQCFPASEEVVVEVPAERFGDARRAKPEKRG